jgi:hypothetical protein
MQEENAKLITVKLRKAGWEVEITCSESQLKQAIESVLSSLEKNPAMSPGKGDLDRETNPGNRTCKGMIMELWEDFWFEKEKSLSEVHEEIARRGHHYDKTAVSHSLRELVIENILSRQGNMRNYMYVQKHPPDRSASNKSAENPSANAA